ncbi:MAG: SDR family oxidoreductase [Desulfurivibrionaceae bacterium]
MYPELTGKTALVTGAVRGFGESIARRLASEGTTVVVNYRRSKSEAQAVASEINEGGGRAVTMRADVAKPAALDRMFERIGSELGGLDILVANAAFGVPGTLMDATDKHWQVTMSASAWSLIELAQRAVPLMPEGRGRIISITSEGGQKVIPGYGVVGPAKAALESITRGLACELGPKGITVNGVCPGLADTKSSRSIAEFDEVLEHAREQTPKGRVVNAEDVAKTVAFLASDQASMILGQFLVVDGGRSIVG